MEIEEDNIEVIGSSELAMNIEDDSNGALTLARSLSLTRAVSLSRSRARSRAGDEAQQQQQQQQGARADLQ